MPGQKFYLETFGTTHGQDVHFASIFFPRVTESWMGDKAKILLRFCSNAQTLRIKSADQFDRKNPGTILAGNAPQRIQLPKFQSLTNLEISTSANLMKLIGEVVWNTPNLRILKGVSDDKVELKEVRPLDLDTGSCLRGVEHFPAATAFEFELILNQTTENTLLKELLTVNLTEDSDWN
jgi:hypothetical protein